MDNFDKACNQLITMGAVLFLVCTGFLVYSEHTRATKYEEACTATNGKPVHNGRQWECLK